LEDHEGKIIYYPLEIAGEPHIILGNKGLYIKEKQGIGDQSKYKFFKINLK